MAPKSQQEIPINYRCKNIIANAMSSYFNVRAQGKTYGDKSAAVLVFNHENIKWEGSVSWLGEVI